MSVRSPLPRRVLFPAFLAFVTVFAGLAVAGCGGGQAAPMPMAALGTYQVTIDANGKTDMDEMFVSLGSNQNVLLTFVYGISEVRGTLAGTQKLSIPRQTVTLDHAIGPGPGIATGEGTVGTSVDITLHVNTTNFGPADGGSGLGGAGVVDYHITGTKN